jgi:hypothetical protein
VNFDVKRRIIVFLGVMNSVVAVYAQGEIDPQQKVFYRDEWSVALMLNSNGFGANYRFGKHVNAANKRLFEADFAYMKDAKENKMVGFSPSGARFVEGKKNLAFDFRFGYGKQHELYRKHDAGGIAIRRFYNFGPSVVLLKPIYYNIGEYVTIPNWGQRWVSSSPPPKKYNTDWHSYNIYIENRASFFKGFSEIIAVPGVFAKFGFNFEYGKQDRIIHALEVGLIAEGFIKKIEIMDFTDPPNGQPKVAQNQQFFLTLFVSYRFGRIIDPSEVKKKRERSKEISY